LVFFLFLPNAERFGQVGVACDLAAVSLLNVKLADQSVSDDTIERVQQHLADLQVDLKSLIAMALQDHQVADRPKFSHRVAPNSSQQNWLT